MSSRATPLEISSSSLRKVRPSFPAIRFCQSVRTSAAPGKRPDMPTIAICRDGLDRAADDEVLSRGAARLPRFAEFVEFVEFVAADAVSSTTPAVGAAAEVALSLAADRFIR